MKKILYTIIAAAAMLTGCNNDLITSGGKGSLSLALNCKTDYTDVSTKAPQTDEDIINGLSIDITRPYDGWRLNYPSFGEIKGKVIELGSGSYILNASSPVKKDAAFEQPIFEGSKGFDIKAGEVTMINLTCTITNMMVTIALSDNFVKELSDYTVTVSNGKGLLSWTKGSGEVNDFEEVEEGGKTVHKGKQAGYFTVAPLVVTVSGHRVIDGSDASTTYNITEANPADHHIIRLDAAVTGSADFNITISNEVNPIDQIVVVPGFDEDPVEGDKPSDGGEDGGEEGGEDPDTSEPETPSTAPTLEWAANPTFADVDLPMSLSAVVDVELVINAPETIGDFLIYVKSGVLTPTIAQLTAAGEGGIVDGVATMDLINDETLIGNLGETIPMGDAVDGKTSVEFSLSKLVPMINMYASDINPGDKHIFTLRVVDAKGQALEQQVTFVSVATE